MSNEQAQGQDARGPLERAYDERINPLMAQIIEIAREAGINYVAYFELDLEGNGGHLACTSARVHPDAGPRLRSVLRAVQGEPSIMAVTVRQN